MADTKVYELNVALLQEPYVAVLRYLDVETLVTAQFDFGRYLDKKCTTVDDLVNMVRKRAHAAQVSR